MEPHTHSRAAASRADDAAPASPPYPLTRGEAGVWLRRGERLGQAARWIAATVAAGHKRAANWRRHAPGRPPVDTPPQPG